LEGDARVRDAQRIVSRQAGCSMEEALALLRDKAVATHQTIKFVAGEVIGGRVRFDPPK
jgi:AmiR/NasT family two-component response regulator